MKGVVNCCKLQFTFKSQNSFCFKYPVPKILPSDVSYKFQCGLCNEYYYGNCVKNLAIRSGENIGISSLINKRLQTRKDIAFCHHLVNYIFLPTFENFSVLCHENKKYLLELKECFIAMGDRPSMN